MNYEEILERIAKANASDPKNIDSEIRSAIKAAGYNIEPEIFILLLVEKVKKEIRDENATPTIFQN